MTIIIATLISRRDIEQVADGLFSLLSVKMQTQQNDRKPLNSSWLYISQIYMYEPIVTHCGCLMKKLCSCTKQNGFGIKTKQQQVLIQPSPYTDKKEKDNENEKVDHDHELCPAERKARFMSLFGELYANRTNMSMWTYELLKNSFAYNKNIGNICRTLQLFKNFCEHDSYWGGTTYFDKYLYKLRIRISLELFLFDSDWRTQQLRHKLTKIEDKNYNNDINNSYNMSNAMVLLICISKYNDQLPDLDGCNTDMKTLVHLFKVVMGYDVIHSTKDKINGDLWVDDQIFMHLLCTTKAKLTDPKNNYDGFIFVFAGHGYHGGMLVVTKMENCHIKRDIEIRVRLNNIYKSRRHHPWTKV